jgi:hypothetical protein
MPNPLRLNAVAFISPQNHPILIRTFSKQGSPSRISISQHKLTEPSWTLFADELKYHYIAHTSLDVIEERGKYQTIVSRRRS